MAIWTYYEGRKIMKINIIEPIKTHEYRKKRVCAYARVSTEEDEQLDSLNNQTTYYHDLISQNDEWEYAGIYSDSGISGFKESRPGFQKMIADARAGKIDLIIVKSVSRFARNTETVLKFSRELKSMGIGIFFELQNINTLSSEGELMLTIIAAFAQAESESASENAKLMFRRKFEAGDYHLPIEKIYGYTTDDEGNVVIDEEAAKVIRLIFDLAEKGIWPSKIKAYLNKNNIPTPKGYAWADGSVDRILNYRDYTGDRILQKTYLDNYRVRHKNKGEAKQWIIKNNHPAIISVEQFDRVHAVIEERRRQLNNKEPINTDVPYSRSTYPLSKMMHCPYCGKYLIHRWENGRRREVWVCRTTQKVGTSACKGIRLPNSVAAEWGEIDEPITVVEYFDDYGMHRFQAYLKREYEASEECLYEIVPDEPKKKIKKEKPKRPRGGQLIRKHTPKPETPRSTHMHYPLSGKLFCEHCGKVLSHRWENGVEYWVCSKNRNRLRKFSDGERCIGTYIPSEIAERWGVFDEEMVVCTYFNDEGKKDYIAYLKEEYENSDECSYKRKE